MSKYAFSIYCIVVCGGFLFMQHTGRNFWHRNDAEKAGRVKKGLEYRRGSIHGGGWLFHK